jgi:predicted permease
MDIYTKALSSVAVLIAVILAAVFLKRLHVIRGEHAPLFSSLVTKVTLPALIFHSLARASLHWEYVLLAAIMFAAEMLSLVTAWAVGRMLRLNSPQMGSFLLVSGFGSSALLGYALVGQVYPGNIAAMTEAVVITELGVGPALFVIGTMIAIYYGSSEIGPKERTRAVLSFFKSPICFSVFAGIGWALLHLPVQGELLTPFFSFFKILASANTFLVALTVGVVLQFTRLREIAAMALAVCMIKLIVKPLLVWFPVLFLPLDATQAQILILEAAMPSALLTVVLARSYGCDAPLASKLVFTTSMVCMATLVPMFRLLA